MNDLSRFHPQTPPPNPPVSDNAKRRNYTAMTPYMDDKLHNMTNLLEAVGMWEDTLLVWFSDNGGPSGADCDSGASTSDLLSRMYDAANDPTNLPPTHSTHSQQLPASRRQVLGL